MARLRWVLGDLRVGLPETQIQPHEQMLGLLQQ